MQQHGHEQDDEDNARADSHRLIRIAEPGTAPEQHQADNTKKKRQPFPLSGEGPRVFKPGQERKQQGKAGKQGSAHLDDGRGQHNADHARDDSSKQRNTLLFM